MKKKMKLKAAAALSALLLLFSGCSIVKAEDPILESAVETPVSEEQGGNTSAEDTPVTEQGDQLSVEYSSKDLETAYDEAKATKIVFQGETVTATGENLTVTGGQVIISAAGSYILSGSSENGQVLVDAPEDADVVLILDGLDLKNTSTSPIRILEADKVILTLAEGSENTVEDAAEFMAEEGDEDEPDAAIYSKADLTLNGTGALTVKGSYNHGIVSKDDLKIVSGDLTVYAVNDGIKGKDMVAVKDGNLTIEAGGDGIQSSNDEDAAKGFVLLEGGVINITAGQDGIQAETILSVRGGEIGIISGGGSENSSQQSAWGSWGKNSGTQTTEEASDSAKGLKAGTALFVSEGVITMDSSDDAVHSNGDIYINGGALEISSGDDGVHADKSLYINAGDIYIVTSYEGLEGASVTIRDGKVHVGAMDDGINTSGGNDGSSVSGRPGQNGFDMSDGTLLTISGGEVFIEAQGDGVDSNGDIEMTGGIVIVHGPEDNGNGAVDYNGSFTVTGGTLLALGSQGMAQNISTSSTQGAFLLNTETFSPGDLVSIKTEEGEEIMSFSSGKSYSSILYSSDQLVLGETYVLYGGGTSDGEIVNGVVQDGTYTGGTQITTVEMTSLQTTLGGSGNGMGPGMGNPDKGFPGKRP